jgi:hypothetical protein
MIDENKVIEVCSECKRASCWYGMFMCEHSMEAGTELRTVKELRGMNTHESEDYWSDEIMTEIYGEPNPHKEGKE